ncbi:MAG: tetratricopeptide repeat protein [Brevinematales bacterium]|nr:tetratricopeptide repeat protein [Brevinematales bacterium]
MNDTLVYSLIKSGKITEALKAFENMLRNNFDEESECGIKVIKHILSKVNRIKNSGDYHTIADNLVTEWKNTVNWINSNNCGKFTEIVESVRYYIFSLALKYYETIIDNISATSNNVIDVDLMIKISRCYREIGETDKCIELLENVRNYDMYDSSVLANLADAYFEIRDIEAAKLFFREAFFWDPQRIDLSDMKSMIVKKLSKIVMDNGYRGEEVNEWIPIYGVIENIFDIRRELSEEEVNMILNRVQVMEKGYNENRKWKNVIEPRLINSYIWLIDYYLLQVGDYELAKSVGKILQKFSPNIYNKLKLGVYKWL